MKTFLEIIVIVSVLVFLLWFFAILLTAKIPDMDEDGQEDSE